MAPNGPARGLHGPARRRPRSEGSNDENFNEKQLQKATSSLLMGAKSPRVVKEPRVKCRSPSTKSTSVATISSKVVETSTAQISIFEAGTASDLPALVLLPGLFCSAHRLLTSLLPLAEHTSLVAVEWRGHGKSVAPKGFQIKDLAMDVMDVIRSRLRGSKLCILGHSIGARVLWAMIDDFKQELSPMLEGVAIIDQGPHASTGKQSAGPTDHAHALYKRDSRSLGSGQKEMLRTLQRLWADVGSGFMHSKSEIAQWLTFAQHVNPVVAASLHWDAMTSDYADAVRSLNARVLLMAGDATVAPGNLYERMGAARPPHGANFVLFPGGTHCLHHQPAHLPKMRSLLEQLLNGLLEPNTFPGQPLPQTVASMMPPQRVPNNVALQKQAAVWPRDLKCSSGPTLVMSAQPGLPRCVLPSKAAAYCLPLALSPRFMGA